MSNSSLESNLENLRVELINYSFNNEFITHNMKEDILTLYKAMYRSHVEKKIFINDLHKKKVEVSENIYADNHKYNKKIDRTMTIFFDTCDGVDIVIKQKLCHLTILNCSNTTIDIQSDIMTGIDIINSKNITIKLSNSYSYYTDYSNTKECQLLFSDMFPDHEVVISLYNTPEFLISKLFENLERKYPIYTSFFNPYKILFITDKLDTLDICHYCHY